ncbi:thioester dehydrase [Rheinheimera sp. D18]|uniref:ApeI family dehydratase n=1 Tax=Rheinheimera sp. D18 TaxID=2545632 RepID=UPI001049ED08|nr:thioester dehydrase [Rheinheimera sp. D18]QBL10696.1 thioester dehydrase [Rheinheimera sp. D18]
MTNLFPTVQVLQHSDHKVELQLGINPEIAYFDGHFPQAPVLAGVTQLHWVVEYCKQHFSQLAEVVSVEVLKFQVMIRPHDSLTLLLELNGESTTQFSYFKQQQKVASGRLKWALKGDA